MLIVYVLLALIVLLVIWGVSVYNRYVRLRNQARKRKARSMRI